MCKQLVYKKGLLLSLIISLFLLPFYSCQEDDNEIYRQLVGAPVQLKIVDKQDSGNRLYSIKNIINLTTGEAFYLNGQAQTKAGIGGDLNTEPRLKNKPYKIIPKYMVDAGERIDPDAIIGSFKKGDRIKVLVEIYEPEEGETLEEYVTTPLRRKIRVVEVVVDYNGKDEIDISVTDPAEEEFNETEITIHHEKGRLAEELGPINFKDGDNVRFIIFGEELTYTDMEVMRLYIHSLTGLELRNNITEIKESQFQYYYKLREVVFPEGITKIGHNAFQNCNSLFSINILNESSYKNNKITFIGEGAFQNCPLQGDLYIPENLTVCKYAFDGVSISLVMIEGNTNFICDPGEWIFYTNYLCQVSYGNPANYKGHNITANVDKFFRMDYENDGKSQLNMIFTNVYFYAGLNYIPKLHADLDFTKMSNKLKTNLIGAFHFETSNYFLTKHPIVSQYNYLYTYSIVFLADGVTTSNLNSLTNNSTCEIALYFRNEVTLPEGTCKGVTSIVLLPGTNKLKSDFLSCKSGIAKDCTIMLYQTEAITLSESMFTDVDLEKAITYVMHPGTPTLKLAQHTKLKAVEITEPMTSTGSLFRGTIFRQITLPYAIQEDKTFAPTLKTISPYAFADCPNLEVILGIDNVETIYREILARTPGIKFLSFYNLKNADSYALMESFVEILDLAGSPLDGDFNMYAFSKAYFLTYVSFVGTKIKTIPKGCFKDDDYLTSVIFGRGDTDYRDIPTQIRTRDGEFKSIPPVTGDYNTCPTLTSIEANAFENCMPLNIAIPSSVTSLGEEAFRGCASLKIGLYEGLKTIKKKCFFDCPGLVSINIPESVTTIEEGAFKTRNPQGLLHVRFNWKTKQTIQFYKSNVWPIGTMIVTIPSDPNVYGDAKYTDKNIKLLEHYTIAGYSKRTTVSKSGTKDERDLWRSTMGEPVLTDHSYTDEMLIQLGLKKRPEDSPVAFYMSIPFLGGAFDFIVWGIKQWIDSKSKSSSTREREKLGYPQVDSIPRVNHPVITENDLLLYTPANQMIDRFIGTVSSVYNIFTIDPNILMGVSEDLRQLVERAGPGSNGYYSYGDNRGILERGLKIREALRIQEGGEVIPEAENFYAMLIRIALAILESNRALHGLFHDMPITQYIKFDMKRYGLRSQANPRFAEPNYNPKLQSLMTQADLVSDKDDEDGVPLETYPKFDAKRRITPHVKNNNGSYFQYERNRSSLQFSYKQDVETSELPPVSIAPLRNILSVKALKAFQPRLHVDTPPLDLFLFCRPGPPAQLVDDPNDHLLHPPRAGEVITRASTGAITSTSFFGVLLEQVVTANPDLAPAALTYTLSTAIPVKATASLSLASNGTVKSAGINQIADKLFAPAAKYPSSYGYFNQSAATFLNSGGVVEPWNPLTPETVPKIPPMTPEVGEIVGGPVNPGSPVPPSPTPPIQTPVPGGAEEGLIMPGPVAAVEPAATPLIPQPVNNPTPLQPAVPNVQVNHVSTPDVTNAGNTFTRQAPASSNVTAPAAGNATAPAGGAPAAPGDKFFSNEKLIPNKVIDSATAAGTSFVMTYFTVIMGVMRAINATITTIKDFTEYEFNNGIWMNEYGLMFKTGFNAADFNELDINALRAAEAEAAALAEAVREAEVAAILEARRAAMKEEEIRVVQQPIYLEVVSNYYALANTLWNMTLWVSKINENHLGVMNFSLEREAYTKNIHELVEKAKNEVDIPLSQELMIHAKLANTDWSIFTARYLTERANQDFKTIKLFGEDNEDHIAKIRAGLQDAQYKANIPGWQMTPDQYNDFLRLEKATRDTVTIYTKKMTEMENVISLLTKDLYENRLYILSSAIAPVNARFAVYKEAIDKSTDLITADRIKLLSIEGSIKNSNNDIRNIIALGKSQKDITKISKDIDKLIELSKAAIALEKDVPSLSSNIQKNVVEVNKVYPKLKPEYDLFYKLFDLEISDGGLSTAKNSNLALESGLPAAKPLKVEIEKLNSTYKGLSSSDIDVTPNVKYINDLLADNKQLILDMATEKVNALVDDFNKLPFPTADVNIVKNSLNEITKMSTNATNLRNEIIELKAKVQNDNSSNRYDNIVKYIRDAVIKTNQLKTIDSQGPDYLEQSNAALARFTSHLSATTKITSDIDTISSKKVGFSSTVLYNVNDIKERYGTITRTYSSLQTNNSNSALYLKKVEELKPLNEPDVLEMKKIFEKDLTTKLEAYKTSIHKFGDGFEGNKKSAENNYSQAVTHRDIIKFLIETRKKYNDNIVEILHNKALLDLEREYISKTLDATEKNLPTINTTYSSYNETITSVSDLILDAKRASIDKDPIIAYIRSRQDIISAIKDLKNKIIALQEEANSYIKVEDTNVQDLDNYIDPNLAQ